jgi:hypothetical protein
MGAVLAKPALHPCFGTNQIQVLATIRSSQELGERLALIIRHA